MHSVHAYMRTYILYMHTYAHAYCTYIHTYVDEYIDAYAHTYMHTCMHAYIHAYVNICIYVGICTVDTHSFVWVFVSMYTFQKYIFRPSYLQSYLQVPHLFIYLHIYHFLKTWLTNKQIKSHENLWIINQWNFTVDCHRDLSFISVILTDLLLQ